MITKNLPNCYIFLPVFTLKYASMQVFKSTYIKICFQKNMKIRFYKIQRILKTNTHLKNMTGQRANTLIFALNIIKPDIFFKT